MATKTIQIRRYPNRRLYDRSHRRYITLPEIEELVREGHTVEVRDSKTDEDLTRLILTQILIERHPDKMEMFPVAMLHSILRANDLALEFLRGTLRQSLAVLEEVQKAGPPFGSPWNWMAAFVPGFASTSPSTGTADLMQRLAELEGRIQRLEGGTGKPPSSFDLGPDSLECLERRVNKLEQPKS